MARILVFGSINLDITVSVPRLPALGETLLGSDALLSPGGKGANQAHAARRFGCDVALYGAVGDDKLGGDAMKLLSREGVDLDGVRTLAAVPTGVACIAVAPDGGNAIIVSPGANAHVRAGWVTPLAASQADVVLLQMEVPVAESMEVARVAKRLGRTVVLNLAPAGDLNTLDVDALDWLVLNETELEQLCMHLGVPPGLIDERAAHVASRWKTGVALTQGAAGAALFAADGQRTACPALAGDIVDTTGAGDTFAGVFCAALAQGRQAADALRFGVVAGSLACRRPGAQAAQPGRAQIDRHMHDA